MTMANRQNGGDAPVLALDLLSLGRLHLLRGEAAGILWHRYMLVVYLVILPVVLLLDTNPQARGYPLEVRGPIYMAAMAATMLTIGAVIDLAFRTGIRRMHLTPVLALSNIAALLASEAVSGLVFPAQSRGWTELLLVYGFYCVMAEFVAAVVVHLVLPKAIGELRGLPIARLAETDPARWQGKMAGTGTDAPPVTGIAGRLELDGRSLPFGSIVHLQAYGNYVVMRSRTGRELVSGPLAKLVAQVPAALGQQVHRSHWVAAAALRGWTISGRDITLYLADGETVPVAKTRRGEVRAWLQSLDIPQGKPK